MLHEDDAQRRIRLEYRPPVDEAMYLDIYIWGQDGRRTGIELKYWTKKANFEVGDEPFRLRDQGAHDICRYDFVKDIGRLERLISADVLDDGWVVALTNDPSYWSPSTRPDTIDAAFRLSDGRTLEGQMGWASHAGSGTTRGRSAVHDLAGRYEVSWRDYSSVRDARPGTFRCLALPVSLAGRLSGSRDGSPGRAGG